jgi:outer membrane protein assembly factor BamB
MRLILLSLLLGTLLLTACGGQVANQNWPGLSTDGNALYLANGPQVAAYDVQTQAQLWQYPPADEVNNALQFFAAPSVTGEQVVFGDYGRPGGFFNPKVTVSIYSRGSIDWTNSGLAYDKIVAPPLQVGDTVYVGTADNMLYALDAGTGQQIWSFEAGHSIWGQPAYDNGKLYVTSLDRSIHALDAETGEELWNTEFEGAIASQPVLNEDSVFVSEFGSQVHAINLTNGDVRWSAAADDWVWGAPAYDNGVVYYADIDGNVFAVDAANGSPKWRAAAAGAVQTAPVVQDGIVYVASEGESSDIPAGALTAFSAADGQQLWRQITPAPLFTTPVIVNDAIVVALTSESAILGAYDRQTGAPLWTIAPPVKG